MTYLAKDLRTQADYIRGCLKFGHLGYADQQMLDNLEMAAARITSQHGDLDQLRDIIKEQAEDITALQAENAKLSGETETLRGALEQVVEDLSSTLAKYQREGSNEVCNSYKLFELLEAARQALK